jgi:hypothetical protein
MIQLTLMVTAADVPGITKPCGPYNNPSDSRMRLATLEHTDQIQYTRVFKKKKKIK